jgi:two-component system OmpR family response regulator
MSARLLLVEDEPDIRLIARAALARAGFEVLTAGDGREALRLVAAAPPDLIVLDWMLPELDGPATCARLKADPVSARIPVVFLTARADDADRARCVAMGAIGAIPKPFNPLTLGNQVAELWHSARDARGDGGR